MKPEVEQLKDILPDLPEADLEALASVLTVREFADGDAICIQGDPGTSAYFIGRGNVEVRVGAARSRVAVLRAGQMFGQMSLVDGGPRSATCRAVGNTVVYELSARGLNGLGRSSAALATRLLWRISRQLAVNLRNADILLTRLAEANPWLELSLRPTRDVPAAAAVPASVKPSVPAKPPTGAAAETFRGQLEFVARNLADVDVRRVRVSATHEATGGTVRDPLRRYRG